LLDSDTRELLRDGHSVPLSPKAFDLLSILVADRPKAISKSDLQERLWPATCVVEKNLANLVSEIRDALGDDPSKPRFIRTVHRFGYAFRETLPRAETGRPASRDGDVSFLLKWVNGRVTLDEGAHVLGRDPDVALPELPRGLAASCADHDFAGPGDDRRPRQQDRDVCRGSASGRRQIAW
jgi:DNA-binding winged helix-turn-helix (wHTH) protein